MWDLIVSVPDHCLSFYFGVLQPTRQLNRNRYMYEAGLLHKVN